VPADVCCQPQREHQPSENEDTSHSHRAFGDPALSGGTFVPQPGRMYDPADFGNISGHLPAPSRLSGYAFPGKKSAGTGSKKVTGNSNESIKCGRLSR
jgi:hypothetical protein